MQMLLPKLKEADVIVWASPVYYAGVTGPLKNLMDRQLPLYLQGGQAKHPKAVLVSTCSAWELSMFDPLLLQMRAIYTKPNESSDFAGALLRPMADGMKDMVKAGDTKLVEDIFLAAREAGRQLAKEGTISEELEARVSRDLMPRDAYYKAAEMMMEQIRKAAEK